MPQVLIDIDVDPTWVENLADETGVTVALAPPSRGSARELPETMLRDVEVMLGSALPTNHPAMTALQWLQLGSAGYAQVENIGLASRGVRVCNASGVNDVPIAEWAVMMMIALTRDLPELMRNQQAAAWDRDARFQQEIRGRTLGVWGYGGIGRETARLAHTLGLRIHALTRSGKIKPRLAFRERDTGDDDGRLPEHVFSLHEATRFCEGLDFLMLAMPLTPDNVALINRDHFQALPDHAFLLNPARGGLVNEGDLLHALETHQIAGAAIDTHFQYPLPPSHPLWRRANVIITPHIAGSSQSTRYLDRLWRLLRENLQRWRTGQVLLNEISQLALDPNAHAHRRNKSSKHGTS